MAEVWTPPAFDDVSTGETVTASQLNAFGNSLRYLEEVDYNEQATDVAVTATTAATANTVVSGNTRTYEAVPHWIEMYAPRVDQAASTCFLLLCDGSTVIGTLTRFAASQNQMPILVKRRITPTAASHTYNVRAYVGSGTWTFQAGSGGAAGDATTDFPIYIWQYRIAT